MERNLKLIKITSALHKSWFWLGIWLVYYLSITDYKGVGIIEMVAFANSFIMEVPTGAISDLFGKKNSLILGYVISGIGNIMMGLSNSLPMLVISVFILGPGDGLVSGTKESLVYDSLKVIKKEKDYEKNLSEINKYQLIFLAGASVIGGFLYKISPSLPFFVTGSLMIFSGLLSSLYKEPPIDTNKFSYDNFIRQTKLGIKYLLNEVYRVRFLVVILLFAAFADMVIQVYDAALAIEFGYKEQALGIFFAVAALVGALGNHYYDKLVRMFKRKHLSLIMIVVFSISIFISPFIGLYLGGLTILLREFFNSYPDTLATKILNGKVESNVRATTISAYYMVKGLPYALTAFFIGAFIDAYTASISLVVLLVIFLAILAAGYLLHPKTRGIYYSK